MHLHYAKTHTHLLACLLARSLAHSIVMRSRMTNSFGTYTHRGDFYSRDTSACRQGSFCISNVFFSASRMCVCVERGAFRFFAGIIFPLLAFFPFFLMRDLILLGCVSVCIVDRMIQWMKISRGWFICIIDDPRRDIFSGFGAGARAMFSEKFVLNI